MQDAAAEARLLQASELGKLVGMDCVIAQDGCSSAAIEDDFASVEVMVLVQTSDVLTLPEILLRAHYGFHTRQLPLVAVEVQGKGYTITKAHRKLHSLAQTLSASHISAMQSYVRAHECSIEQLGASLENHLTSIIASCLDPMGSELHINAVAKELAKKIRSAWPSKTKGTHKHQRAHKHDRKVIKQRPTEKKANTHDVIFEHDDVVYAAASPA